MANWNGIKDTIRTNVYENSNEEITGTKLQNVLIAVIDQLVGSGYIWQGFMTPQSVITTPDGRVFYFALQTGTYPVGDITLTGSEIGVIYYDTEWRVNKLSILTQQNLIEAVTQALANYYTKTQVDSLLSSETSARTSADTNLQTAITNEATARANADTALGERIDNISSVGRFLSVWDCSTGLPQTNPTTSPYPYVRGDYFVVGKTGNTNYKPSGTQFVIGQASTAVETNEVNVNDIYKYDGTVWTLLTKEQVAVVWGNIGGTLSQQTDLANALSAKYTKPSSGIPSTDLASGVQTSLGKADSAYQKPSSGIPATDMASGVVASLGLADSAYQKPNTGIPSSDMTSAVQTSLSKADSAYQKPANGIPSTDLASGVQTSLGKADTALQSVPNTYRTASAQDVIDAGKQNVISDLDTIRSGAALGATALQSVPNTYRTSAEQDTIDNGKQATLVSGTNIKTINNQSILGAGNIEISGGGTPAWGAITGTLSDQTDLQAELDDKADVAEQIDVADTTASQELAPNTQYVFASRTSALTLTLGTEVSGQVNLFAFDIQIGATLPNITMPSGVTGSPTFAANKYYSIIIQNNKVFYKEF